MNFKNINYKRYGLYLLSLFIISLGASLSIKANLGTSPLICIPYVSSLITYLSVGTTSFIFNIFLIFLQALLLRKIFIKAIPPNSYRNNIQRIYRLYTYAGKFLKSC